MRYFRQILVSSLLLALTAYALDCDGMTTPEQAMQCCNSMLCSSQGHMNGQDCCETMPTMHSPFVTTSMVQGAAFSHAEVAGLDAANTSANLDSVTSSVAAHSHAPPIFYSSVPLSLRI